MATHADGTRAPNAAAPAILVIDNYDSFVFNLVHDVERLGGRTQVARNDALSLEDALAARVDGYLISPGPGTPEAAGVSVALARAAGDARRPVFGVCLGHQAIAAAYGARVGPARTIRHGKTSPITHDANGVFAGVEAAFTATRYHSLAVDEATLPDDLHVTARAEDGEIMGLAHRRHPVFGVQFHPESYASEHGLTLLTNFLNAAVAARDHQQERAS